MGREKERVTGERRCEGRKGERGREKAGGEK